MTTYTIYFQTEDHNSKIKRDVKESDVVDALREIHDRYTGCFIQRVIDYYGNDFEA
jgi:hypothetical protein